MVNSKVQTVIVNRTQQVLVLHVGNYNHFAKLATIAVGGEHQIEIDVNWTYQELSLEPAGKSGHVTKRVIVSSDDCCDCMRITVTMSTDGSLQTDKIARGLSGCNVDDLPLNKTATPQLNCSSDHRSRSRFNWLPKELKFNWRF